MGFNTLASGIASSIASGLLLIAVAILCYALVVGIYNVYLHPLRAYPGPLLWRAYQWPYALSSIRGNFPFDANALHQKYGPVVRMTPFMLSYSDSRALKAIYSHHNPATEGFSEMGKDPIEYQSSTNGSFHFLNAPQQDHGRFRKLFSHSFSERGMREMQPRIQGFVELLMKGLKESAGTGYTNLSQWYNWTTFDMIGDLAFGDSFHCLETKTTSPWIEAVFGSVKALVFTMVIRLYGLEWLLPYITPKRLYNLRYANYNYARQKMNKRIDMGVDQNDFFDKAIAQSDFEKGTGLSRNEMIANASVMILAGSETTATLLSGTTFLLCKHPEVLRKLNQEIRSAFTSEDEIDLLSVSKLDYLLAVLNEAMRIYPPAPNVGARVVPKQGTMVMDKWVPGGVSIRFHPYAANHSPANFHRSDDFCPERWLSTPPKEFVNDDRASCVPFSMGPRNCVGRNLAYAEMRLIMAKVCWNFDMELDEERCSEWMKGQKIYFLWEKASLWVRLTAVKK